MLGSSPACGSKVALRLYRGIYSGVLCWHWQSDSDSERRRFDSYSRNALDEASHHIGIERRCRRVTAGRHCPNLGQTKPLPGHEFREEQKLSQHMVLWSSWSARHPVKVKVAGSSPVRIARVSTDALRAWRNNICGQPRV